MQYNKNLSDAQFNDIEVALDQTRDRIALFSSSDFRERLYRRLFADPAIKVWSLDVFDTVLLRDNSSELTRFLEIGAAMSKVANDTGYTRTFKAVDAFLARHMGTKATYRGSDPRDGCVEGSLGEIHTVASRLLTGNSELTEKFIEAELEYESTRLSLNETLVNAVVDFKGRGGSVILVSDMYMHAVHIKHLLKKKGVDLALFDGVFSSADLKFSKHSGKVFPYLENELATAAAQILHIGDNLQSDFMKALEHGFAALHLPIPSTDASIRRQDHRRTAEMLKRDHGVLLDIAMPH
ncbi:hypothetical protein [Agrobacterium sp. SORGH_AS 787]|uniref:hypothetical protein n=1 Tax=Agrobacterium sp. SORGH_AS 787 TaxID=3041775 RepID=UPI00278A8855|nr:putative HAD superfamily hydrolase [Rhizobium sp. SORGH_AS_0787]